MMKIKDKFSKDCSWGVINGDIEYTMTTRTIANNLPMLKYSTWKQVCSFMKWASKKQNAEAVVSLTVINGEWRVICWHQQTIGQLHVKFDQSSEENQALLTDEEKLALTHVHCTIHSHNKSSAFQSGDDQEDEAPKRGWHITVGTLDKPEMSIHCRFNYKVNAKFDENGVKISNAEQFFIEAPLSLITEKIEFSDEIKSQTTPKQRDEISNIIFKNTPADDQFPEEWKERNKRIVQQYHNPVVMQMGENPWWEKKTGKSIVKKSSPHLTIPQRLKIMKNSRIVKKELAETIAKCLDSWLKIAKGLKSSDMFVLNDEIMMDLQAEMKGSLGSFCLEGTITDKIEDTINLMLKEKKKPTQIYEELVKQMELTN